jgi:DNA-binding transcriptional LysR family regulator
VSPVVRRASGGEQRCRPQRHREVSQEAEPGVELFQRTSRVVTATEAGHLFAEHARGVLASFDFAVAEARRAGAVGAASDRLRQAPSSALARALPRLLRERRPHLLTEVTNLLALEQVQRLRDGQLDLGIVPYAEDYEGIELEPLFPGESFVIVLRPGHRLAAKEVLGPNDLRDEVLVMLAPLSMQTPCWRGARLRLDPCSRCSRRREMPRVLSGMEPTRSRALRPLRRRSDRVAACSTM